MSRKEIHDPELVEKIAGHYREILKLIGEDPTREGLLKTPQRAAKALIDATCGYRADVQALAQKQFLSMMAPAWSWCAELNSIAFASIIFFPFRHCDNRLYS